LDNKVLEIEESFAFP